jgi:uncharacterized cupredoxin-like copper-binding protein
LIEQQKGLNVNANTILGKTVVSTPLDSKDGALGFKRLAALVAIILVVGGSVIFGVQHYITTNEMWKATVVDVAERTVNISFNAEHGELEVASYPSSLKLHAGDRVLVHVDEDEGNSVVRVVSR